MMQQGWGWSELHALVYMKNFNVREHVGDLGVDALIILKYIFSVHLRIKINLHYKYTHIYTNAPSILHKIH